MSDKIRIREVDIIKFFTELLENYFELEVVNVVEDYKRPCFFTEVLAFPVKRFMTSDIVSEYSFKIYYFPSKDENVESELSLMKSRMIDLFYLELDSLLPIDSKQPIEFHDLRFEVVKDVLQVSVDFNIVHKMIRDEDKEMMEDLHLTKIVNGSKVEDE